MHSDEKKPTRAQAAFAKAIRLMRLHPIGEVSTTTILDINVKPYAPDPPDQEGSTLEGILVTVRFVITPVPLEVGNA